MGMRSKAIRTPFQFAWQRKYYLHVLSFFGGISDKFGEVVVDGTGLF